MGMKSNAELSAIRKACQLQPQWPARSLCHSRGFCHLVRVSDKEQVSKRPLLPGKVFFLSQHVPRSEHHTCNNHEYRKSFFGFEVSQVFVLSPSDTLSKRSQHLAGPQFQATSFQQNQFQHAPARHPLEGILGIQVLLRLDTCLLSTHTAWPHPFALTTDELHYWGKIMPQEHHQR